MISGVDNIVLQVRLIWESQPFRHSVSTLYSYQHDNVIHMASYFSQKACVEYMIVH